MAEIHEHLHFLTALAFILGCGFVFFRALQLKRATLKIADAVQGDMVLLLSQNRMLVAHIDRLNSEVSLLNKHIESITAENQSLHYLVEKLTRDVEKMEEMLRLRDTMH